MDTRFTGVIPPLITPFTQDGAVDLGGLDRVIEHLVSGGVNGLFVLGSSGETAYLTDAERDAVIERAVATTAGRFQHQWAAFTLMGISLASLQRGEEAVLAYHASIARHDSAEDFCRLNALLCTAVGWIFIPAYCFALP